MEDYDRIGNSWVPYVMTGQLPGRILPAVTTDAYGFRTTIGKDEVNAVHYEDFISRKADRKGVLLGASAAFGVGATSDKFSIPSILNRQTDGLWYNFGGRSFNSTQETVRFVLHSPRNVSDVVVFSGINNLTLAYLAPKTSPIYNSFFNQSLFEWASEGLGEKPIGVRRSVHRLLQELKYRLSLSLSSKQYQRVQDDLKGQYTDILECFRRDISVLDSLGWAQGFEVKFAFQPVATWIDKTLTDEETKIFRILDGMPRDWEVLARFITNHREQYLSDVERICADQGVRFCDMNKDARFASDEWLFVDRVHLTVRGYALAAEIIQEAFQL